MSVRENIIHELFVPARRNFRKIKVVVKEPWEIISADIVDMKKYKTLNKNYAYILTIIDNFTKFAYAFSENQDGFGSG